MQSVYYVMYTSVQKSLLLAIYLTKIQRKQ